MKNAKIRHQSHRFYKKRKGAIAFACAKLRTYATRVYASESAKGVCSSAKYYICTAVVALRRLSGATPSFRRNIAKLLNSKFKIDYSKYIVYNLLSII